MFNGVKDHYNQYYHYDIPSGEEPGAVVNSLYDSVMRNDRKALDEVLRILASNTYQMVCRRLDRDGQATRENVDDVMQNISMEVLKKAFRGFPGYVKEDILYPYLIGIAETCVDNFKKNVQINNRHEQYDSNDYSVFKAIEDKKAGSNILTPEENTLLEERRTVREIILRNYVCALEDSKLPPYQLLTYCYAILLPQLFKKTDKRELLYQIDRLSGRKSSPPNSHYNEEKNCLEGDITRDSVILMNWAMEAMYNQTISELDQEFLSLYDIEKIAGVVFQWGSYYRARMEEEYDNIPMRQVIITEMFEKNAIKNWPKRVAKSLLVDTERRFILQREYCEKSVSIVEEMLL